MGVKKAEERALLTQVFGQRAAEAAQDSERPDFLLATGDNQRLGIEVTSIYAHLSDARLRNVPGYSMGLIDQTIQPHRLDQNALKVSETVLEKQNGEKIKMIGIFQEKPSLRESYQILLAKIAEKEAKAPDYLRQCDMADLIVLDGSLLFFHLKDESFQQSYLTLVSREQIIATPFREIHLVTRNEEQQDIVIPLVTTWFVADCYAYAHLLSKYPKEMPAADKARLITACMHAHGYRRAKVAVYDQGLGFLYGAWEIYFLRGKCDIRDWTAPHENYPGAPLEKALADSDGIDRSLVDELMVQRKALYSAIPVQLPIHTDA